MRVFHSNIITIFSLLLFLQVGCNRSTTGKNVSTGGEANAEKVNSPALEKSDPEAEESMRQAALEGLLDKVKILLKDGTKVDAIDPDGHTALMFAAFNGHSEIILTLLEHGAKIDQRDTMGRTALLYASTGPFPEVVSILLDKGAQPNIVDSDEHFTPLMHAAAEGNLEVVKILVENGADMKLTDVDGDDAESFARQAGHSQVADYLKSLH